jgi:hypothetical protein
LGKGKMWKSRKHKLWLRLQLNFRCKLRLKYHSHQHKLPLNLFFSCTLKLLFLSILIYHHLRNLLTNAYCLFLPMHFLSHIILPNLRKYHILINIYFPLINRPPLFKNCKLRSLNSSTIRKFFLIFRKTVLKT